MAIEIYEFGAWEPDVSDFEQNGLEYAQNAVSMDGVYREVSAYTNKASAGKPNLVTPWDGARPLEVVSAVPAANEGVYCSYEDSSLGTRIMHITTAAAFSDQSKGAGYGALNAFRFAQFGSGNILATTIENPLQVRSSSGAFADAITSTTKPQGRFIGVIRSHVLMAYIKESGTYYGARFWWCAKNDLSDWEPGSSLAGWAELSGADGALTGLETWEDFGILFTEFGVHRLTYVGGSNLWTRQQVGGAEHGKDFFSDPVIYGRDCYYWSRQGIKVVRDGEVIESISDGRTTFFLTDQGRSPKWARKTDSPVQSAVSSHWRSVCFLYKIHAEDVSADQLWAAAVYSIADDRWGMAGVFDGDFFIGGTEASRYLQIVPWRKMPSGSFPVARFPLDDIGFVFHAPDHGTPQMGAGPLGHPYQTGPYKLTTRNYKGLAGERTALKRIRPLFLKSDDTVGGSAGRYAAGDPKLTIEWTNDFNFRTKIRTGVIGTTLGDAGYTVPKDRSGYWQPDSYSGSFRLPIKGGCFRFSLEFGTLSVRDVDDFAVITESTGIELDIAKAGRGG